MNTILETNLQTIDTTIESGILLEREETRPKRTKKTETSSSEKPVKEFKSMKIPKNQPITDEEPVTHEVLVVDTTLTKPVVQKLKKKKLFLRRPGVQFREIPTPVSPSSKKRTAVDMAKHISKKKKKISKMIIYSESTDDKDERIRETLKANLQKDTSTRSQTAVIPPEDSVSKSFSEEARTFDILVYVSNTDANVLMGEDDSKKAEQGFGGTSENLVFGEDEADFPDHMLMTMKQILNTKLNCILQSEADLGGGNSASSLEVDGLLKLLEGRITLKVYIMIKDYKFCILEKVDLCDQNNELSVNSQNSTFEGDLKELRKETKERHVLFTQDVKKVREDVNFKLQELCQYMDKEIACVRTAYASLNQKVDIICDAMMIFSKLYESLSPQLSQLYTTERKIFMEVITLLMGIKELSTKLVSSSQLSSDFLLQIFLNSKIYFSNNLLLFLAYPTFFQQQMPHLFIQGCKGERKGEDSKAGGDDVKIHPM
ncbi:unnamed protein product [Lactuca saligna]|uniref:Uncharacterized protein n=1 Tax=Lactuca saligna TaxID=75948 RepID=A0AA35VYQ6_LACSI|nr:unnamed protein product [Lactuca saligna]